ncbi:hypothetical protein ACIOJD_01540 [Streptomyces sp. NPDC088116]|uniref:hypothetical protein n=1 Tax=Streptomyces sp. NPDC088116 TaxID=3365825 RepID=UPI0037F8FFC1
MYELRNKARGIAVLAALMVAGTGAVTATPAMASPSDVKAVNFTGTVTARDFVAIREEPRVSAKEWGRINSDRKVRLDCFVRGGNVEGNHKWYRLSGQIGKYVSARWVSASGVPECRL